MIVGLLLVPMMLLVAFALDLGMAYAQAQAYGAGANSGALAIVSAKRANLNAHASAPGNCQSLVTSDAGQALAIAKKQADANRPYDLKATTGQVDVQVSLTCVDKNGAPDPNGVLRVKVTVHGRAHHARKARRHQLDQGDPQRRSRARCYPGRRRGLPPDHL